LACVYFYNVLLSTFIIIKDVSFSFIFCQKIEYLFLTHVIQIQILKEQDWITLADLPLLVSESHVLMEILLLWFLQVSPLCTENSHYDSE
jgi:hypothetical protein